MQMEPKFHLVSGEKEREQSKRNETISSDKFVVSQTWQKSGRCPKGTVPIRRVRREELLRADSVEHFGRKKPQPFFAAPNTTTTDDIIYVNNTKLTFASQVNRSVSQLCFEQCPINSLFTWNSHKCTCL